jgi:hypothetical protein
LRKGHAAFRVSFLTSAKTRSTRRDGFTRGSGSI